MLKFTLMRNLFKELNPSRMEGVQQRRVRDNFSRTMAVAYEDVPEVRAFTIQERAVSYGVLYYLFLNDDRTQADLEEVRVKKFLLAFYGDHFPSYLKDEYRKLADLSEEELKKIDVLDCFLPDNMPGHHDGYAFQELQTLEDIRAGRTGDEDKPRYGFPGLTFAKKYDPENRKE